MQSSSTSGIQWKGPPPFIGHNLNIVPKSIIDVVLRSSEQAEKIETGRTIVIMKVHFTTPVITVELLFKSVLSFIIATKTHDQSLEGEWLCSDQRCHRQSHQWCEGLDHM